MKPEEAAQAYWDSLEELGLYGRGPKEQEVAAMAGHLRAHPLRGNENWEKNFKEVVQYVLMLRDAGVDWQDRRVLVVGGGWFTDTKAFLAMPGPASLVRIFEPHPDNVRLGEAFLSREIAEGRAEIVGRALVASPDRLEVGLGIQHRPRAMTHSTATVSTERGQLPRIGVPASYVVDEVRAFDPQLAVVDCEGEECFYPWKDVLDAAPSLEALLMEVHASEPPGAAALKVGLQELERRFAVVRAPAIKDGPTSTSESRSLGLWKRR